MTAMNRRSLLGGLAAVALGCTLIPTVTESAPRMDNALAGPPESPIEEASGRRRRRRRRRRHCFVDRFGRRRCHWRYF